MRNILVILYSLLLILFPGVLFTGFFILNLFVWGAKSSGAVPFSTLVALLVLWLGISVPLVYMGSYIALQQKPIEPPVKVIQCSFVSRMLSMQIVFLLVVHVRCLPHAIVPFCV